MTLTGVGSIALLGGRLLFERIKVIWGSLLYREKTETPRERGKDRSQQGRFLIRQHGIVALRPPTESPTGCVEGGTDYPLLEKMRGRTVHHAATA